VEAILRMRSRIEALEERLRPFSQLPGMPETWMLASSDKRDEETD
jgi:hypothetical protein